MICPKTTETLLGNFISAWSRYEDRDEPETSRWPFPIEFYEPMIQERNYSLALQRSKFQL